MPRWPQRTFSERLWSKVAKGADEECWVWLGHKNAAGYGVINLGTKQGNALAHRVTYAELNGPIPKGMTIDHLCLNHACVNPGHMEVVTRSENARRQVLLAHNNRDKTHCKNGHPFDEVNTYLSPRPDGKAMRTCRICNNLAGQRYYARQKLIRQSQRATQNA